MHGVDELIRALAHDLVRAEVGPGEVVIRAGEPSSGLVRVVQGVLDVDVVRGERSIRVAAVGPGAVLGGVGLLAGGLSTATVTAREPGVIEVLPAEVVRSHLAADPSLADGLAEQVRATIDRDALLLVLSDLLHDTSQELVEVSRSLRVRDVPGGEVLCQQGGTDTTAWIVVAGRLSIRRDDGDGVVEVSRVGRGQIVGERALVTGEPRDATVVAVRDTVLAEVDEDDFHTLLVEHPEVARELMRQVIMRRDAVVGAWRHEVSTLAVVSASDAMSTDELARAFADTLDAHAVVQRLTAGRVDAELATDGASNASDGTTARRLASYLHEQEAAVELLLLEMAGDGSAWDTRAGRVADRIVVLLHAAAPEQERARVRAVVASAPAGVEVVALLHHAPDTVRPNGTAALIADLGVHDALHLRDERAEDLQRAARLTAGRGVALVLGGGGAKGYAHIGVQQALHELGVPVDLIVGASMGALLGAGMATGLDHDTLPATAARLASGGMDYTLPVTSLLKGEASARAFETEFGAWEFEDLWTPYRCVSTNLTRSHVVVHDSGPLVPPLRATSAIPGVLPPVPMGEDLLVDGGVLNNVPVDVATADGRCATLIVVDVAPPMGPGASEDYGLSVSGWSALRASVRKGRSQYPGIAAVLMRSMIVGSMVHRRQTLGDAEVALLLELHVRGVSLLDLEVVEPVVALGHELARPRIEAWLAETGWPAGTG